MSKKKSKCVWKREKSARYYARYSTCCDDDQWFDMLDFVELKFKFCPYCGKEIKVKE